MSSKTIIKLLCSSIVIIIIGGILCVVGFVNGGVLSIRRAHFGPVQTYEWSEYSETSSNEKQSYTSENEVTSFKADIDYGDIEIIQGTSFSIRTAGIDANNITISEMNGEYTFTLTDDAFSMITNNGGPSIYVTLPSSTKEVSINQSLGTIELTNLTLSTLSIDNSLGDVEMEYVNIDQGNIHLAMGELSFKGDFTTRLDITNNLGDVEIELMKTQLDYNYDLHLNIGELKINDHEQDSIDYSYQQNNQKNATLHASLDMGSLDIEFGID